MVKIVLDLGFRKSDRARIYFILRINTNIFLTFPANSFCPRPANAPPPYAPPCGAYYSPPPAYYWTGGQYNGYQAPTNAFPEQPPRENIFLKNTELINFFKLLFSAESVFMYEQPPPYAGIGPVAPNPNPTPNAHPSAGGGPPQPGFPGASAPPAYCSSGQPSMAPYPAAPLPSYEQASSLPQKAKVE